MSIEINNVVIGGNLTKDVVLKDTQTGKKVCTFTVAVNNTFVSNGEKRTDTAFIDVDVWGVVAENCSKYLGKGSPVVVIGRIKQDRWETPNGEKRSRLKIVAATVQFLPNARRENQQTEEQGGVPVGAATSSDVAWDE